MKLSKRDKKVRKYIKSRCKVLSEILDVNMMVRYVQHDLNIEVTPETIHTIIQSSKYLEISNRYNRPTIKYLTHE